VSIFDTLFGDNSTTSETRTALTGPATGAATTLFNTANSAANKPFTPYGGPRVADLTGDQQWAASNARGINSASSDLYSRLVGAVNSGLTNRGGAITQMGRGADTSNDLAQRGVGALQQLAVAFPNANISAYMNPYVQDVLDPAIRDLTRNAEENRQKLVARSAMTGSFGGSRNQLAQSQAQQDTEEEIGRLSAAERARAFTAATEQFRADQTAIPALYAAGQNLVNNAQGATINADNFTRLGYQDIQNLIGANQGRLATEVNPMLTTGGLQQGVDQNRLDAAYQEFQNGQNWDLRSIEALTKAFGAGNGATGQTTTSTVTPPQPNPVGQVLGSVVGGLGSIGTIANAAAPALNWIGNQASSWFGGGGSGAGELASAGGGALKSWFA